MREIQGDTPQEAERAQGREGSETYFVSAHTTAKPTAQLRWVPRSMMQAHDLKLQQAWETVHYKGDRPVRIEIEWRDIPVEQG